VLIWRSSDRHYIRDEARFAACGDAGPTNPISRERDRLSPVSIADPWRIDQDRIAHRGLRRPRWRCPQVLSGFEFVSGVGFALLGG